MENPTLYILPKKYVGESTVVSMRLPKDMIEELDSIAKATGRTRSELMSTCLEFAMQHMEIVDNRENKQEG